MDFEAAFVSQLSFKAWPADAASDDGLQHVAEIHGLRRLFLFNTDVSDSELEFLGLQNTRITGPGLAHLKEMTQLQSIHLAHTRISDEGIGHLANLQNLERLDFSGTRVTDEGLKHLKGLTALKYVGLSPENTDVGLRHLEGLNLQELYVSPYTRITEGGLNTLRQKMPNLKVPLHDGQSLSP